MVGEAEVVSHGTDSWNVKRCRCGRPRDQVGRSACAACQQAALARLTGLLRGEIAPTVKGCSKCGGPLDRPGQRYCRGCHAAYARAHRPKHADLHNEARQRAICRAHTKVLVRRGHLVKTPCACGALDVSAVHLNWDDPRAVVWRCSRCRRSEATRRIAAA